MLEKKLRKLQQLLTQIVVREVIVPELRLCSRDENKTLHASKINESAILDPNQYYLEHQCRSAPRTSSQFAMVLVSSIEPFWLSRMTKP
jgi:hypothetical protein